MINKMPSHILLKDVSQLIEEAKSYVAKQVNFTLVKLYWQIGQRINDEVLKETRAEYGEKAIKQLSQQLTIRYGRGFNIRSLFRMVRFVKLYPDENMVSTLSTQLSWSHFVELTALND